MKTPAAELFALICDANTLTIAWAKVRGNRGGPGGDGETIALFSRQAGARIERLARELAAGTYRPGPLRRLMIRKKGGGDRLLAIPCVADRIVQTAAAGLLADVLDPEFEDASHAYRLGRGVATAVARVSALQRQGYTHVVDGDIRAYFDSVPHAPLLARLGRSIADRRLVDLVALWLDGFDDDGIGLPQGAPISPVLANLYLDEVDEAIETAGVRLVRYADDFLLLCKGEALAAGALERIAALLADRGLELKPEKTRIVRFQDGFKFLGHLFVRSLVVKAEPEPADAVAVAEDAAADNADADDAIADDEMVAVPERGIPPAAAVEDSGGGEDLRAAFGAAPHGRFQPILAPLYVMEKGRELDLRNEAFVVRDGEAELLALPPDQVDRIELGPSVSISNRALRQAMDWRVPVAMLNGWGEPIGWVEPLLAARADLHLAQAASVLDPPRRLALARVLVEGRLKSQQRKLKKLNLGAGIGRVDRVAAALLSDARRARAAGSVEQAMGYEGRATARYWPALGALLKHGWRLDRRRRMPPPDPVNAVISWLSWLLTRDIQALVLRRGLHPGFGILHGTRDRHVGAVYDLVEEFRAPLAEGLAVALFNRRHLRAEHFYEADGVRLGSEGRRIVIRAYEAKLDQERGNRVRQRRTSWRGIMQDQIDAYARHFLAGEPYRPCELDY
jgi:CRISPR-associated protein Cas1